MAQRMITIEGLTVKQKVFMDTLWAMENMDQVQAFVKSLMPADAMDCLSLIEILIQETYEQEGGMDEYKDAATAAIASCMR